MRTFQTVQLYDNLSLLDNLMIAAQQFDDAGFVDEFLRTRRYCDAVAAAPVSNGVISDQNRRANLRASTRLRIALVCKLRSRAFRKKA